MARHYVAPVLKRGRAIAVAGAVCVLAACGERQAEPPSEFTALMVQLQDLGTEATALDLARSVAGAKGDDLKKRADILETRTRTLEQKLAPLVQAVLPGADSSYGEFEWSVAITPGQARFKAVRPRTQGEVVFEGSLVRVPRVTSSKVAGYPRRCGDYPAKWESGPSNSVFHVLAGQTELTVHTADPRYMPPASFEWVVRAFDLDTLSRL